MALERLTQITEVGIQSGITLRNINVEGAYVSGVITATSLSVTVGTNFAGVVTATSFSGNLTGNVNATGVSTFSGGIQGNVTGNINSTGVSTFTSVNVTGNVSIGGTLTYEDVTNVDSIGLVTARTGVRIDAGGLVVTAGVSTFTNGPVLVGTATSTGTASQRLQVTGGAYVSGNLGINTTAPAKKLHVQTSFVSGAARGGGFTQTLFESNQASATYWEFQANASSTNDILFSKSNTGSYGIVGYDHSTEALRFHSNSAERMRIDSAGNVLVGTATSTGTASQTLQVTGGAYVSGNLGVGVTNPGSKLDIVGDIRFGKQDYSYQSIQKVATLNADGISAVYPPGSFRFYTYPGYINTSTLRLGIRGQDDVLGETNDLVTIVSTSATSGRVGIGTINPSAKLDVEDNNSSGYIAEFRQKNTSNSAQILIDSPTNGESRPVSMDMSRAGVLQWSIGQAYNDTNQSFHIATSALQSGNTGSKLCIDTSGNIGINDTSPGTRVSGFIVRGTDTRYFTVNKVTGQPIWRFDDNSTGSALLQNLGMTAANQGMGIQWQLGDTVANSAVGGSIYCLAEQTWTSTASTKDSYLRFDTTSDGVSAEKVRINSSGNVILSGNTVVLESAPYTASSSIQTHTRFISYQKEQGYNQTSWYYLLVGSGSNSRAGSIRLRVNWTTGHAAGVGYHESHVVWRNKHDNSKCDIMEFGRLRENYWNGSYYSWTSAPTVYIYNSDFTGVSAGIWIRIDGHINTNSNTYDGGVVQHAFIELYGNNYITTPSFLWNSNSTPGNVGSQVTATQL